MIGKEVIGMLKKVVLGGGVYLQDCGFYFSCDT